jgi:MFS family permease
MSDSASTVRKVSYVAALTAIYAVYFIIPDTGFITPALANIAVVTGAPPDQVSYLSTLPSVAQIISALLCAVIAGKYVKNRTLLILAVAGFTVSGVIPAFLAADTPFAILLVTRFLLGFFLGFLMPIINTAIAHIFSDENKRATIYGRANLFFNVGSIAGLMLGGYAASFAWNGSFWLYSVGIVVLIIVLLFYKEDVMSAPKEQLQTKDGKVKVKIPLIIFAIMFVQMLAMVFDMTFFSMLPAAFMFHNLGDPAMIGTLMSIFTVAGVIVSFLFGSLFKIFKKWALVFGAFVAAAGMLLTYLGCASFESLVIVIIAVLVLGFGHTIVGLSVTQIISISVAPAIMVAAMGFYKVGMDLGNFISSPFISTVTAVLQIPPDGDFSAIFAAAAVGMVVTGIVAVFVAIKTKPFNEIQSGEK